MTDAAAPSRRFSIAQLVLFVPWVALVIGAWGEISDNSFLWHVRAGSLQIEAGAVLTSDPFSFVLDGASWRTQSWLIELLYGQLETWFGLSFVPYVVLGASGVTIVAVGLLVRRLSESTTAAAFVLTLLTIGLISFLVPRPVVVSFALFALVLLAWDIPSVRWALPFLFWLWASIHASFAIGLFYLGLRILLDKEWKALPTAVVAGLLTLLTAHGLGIIEFLIGFLENREGLEYITEWRRPELLETVFLPIVGLSIFILIGVLRRILPARYLLVVLPFVAMSITSVRAIPPALLALTPISAMALSGLSIGSRSGLRPRLAVVFLVIVGLLPFLLIKGAQLSPERFPIQAAAHISAGNTFHDDKTGGYLIYRSGPRTQVYIDDRAELYGSRLGEFVGVRSGEIDWEPVFVRDGIDQALLNVEEPLTAALVDAGWRQVHADENFIVLKR